jgi:predicted transposase/invertase (TIGR01784 family)
MRNIERLNNAIQQARNFSSVRIWKSSDFHVILPYVEHKIKRNMARYLDPKNDLTFKRIFGEHPRLLVSFLNALMPLEPGRLIESIEYLPVEQVPDNPLKKNSIVDVKCIDNYQRQFIIEMQMLWSDLFRNRLLFNASKAYVRQLDKNGSYELLHPVYGLGIVNKTFDRRTDDFYHHYRIINCSNPDDMIKGLEFVLVELPKFKARKWEERKMAALWLRFLSEVENKTECVSPDLLANDDIREALALCEEGAFTSEELMRYEQYWDWVRTENGLISVAENKGRAEGEAKGRAEGLVEGEARGLAKGRAEGRVEELERSVLAAYQNHFSIEQIRLFSGLDEEAILEILKRNNPLCVI